GWSPDAPSSGTNSAAFFFFAFAKGLARSNELVNNKPTTRIRVMRGPRWLCVTARNGETLLRRIPKERDHESQLPNPYTAPTLPAIAFKAPHARARAWSYIPKTRSCYASANFCVKEIRARNQEISRVIHLSGARPARVFFDRFFSV